MKKIKWVFMMIAIAVVIGVTGCRADVADSTETNALENMEVQTTISDDETEADKGSHSVNGTGAAVDHSESAGEFPDWMETAWEGFEVYRDPARVSYSDFYEGFMDEIAYYYEEGELFQKFPAIDYESDGLVDRIYVHQDDYKSEVYLFSGNGSTFLLGKPNWYTLGETVSADLTGDGINELIYISGTPGTGGDTFYIAIWELVDNQWRQMDIAPAIRAMADEARYAKILTLTVRVEKLDETHIKITQPDMNRLMTFEVSETGMDNQWFWDDEEPHETEIWSSGDYAAIKVVEDAESGKAYLQVTGSYGDKWVQQIVHWSLEYGDGRWNIVDFSLE